MYTLIFNGQASKGSRISGARRGRQGGETTTQLMFAWSYYPPVPCSKMVGGVLTMRPVSNSDNLQFPIVLLALGVELREKGRVYSTLPFPTLLFPTLSK